MCQVRVFVRERLSCKNKSGFARLSDQPTGFVSVHFFARTTLTFPLMVFHLPSFLSLPLRTYSLTLVSAIPPFHAALVASSRKQLVRNFQSYRPIIAYRVNFDIFFFFSTTIVLDLMRETKGKILKKKWIY